MKDIWDTGIFIYAIYIIYIKYIYFCSTEHL